MMPGQRLGRDVLARLLHQAQVGCYELAHWENTGEGNWQDHYEDADAIAREAASLVEVSGGEPARYAAMLAEIETESAL